MEDESKTRKQLIDELRNLRLKISELESPRLRNHIPSPCESRPVSGEKFHSSSPTVERRETIGPTLGGQSFQRILESPSKWQTVFNSITDAICLLDMKDRVLDCNEAMLKLLGKPIGDVIGNTCWMLMHGTAPPIDDCPVVRMRNSHSRESQELSIRGRWFDVIAHPVSDEVGDLIGAVHILSEISRRKEAEDALRRSEEKYRELVEFTNSIILRVDKHGFITFLNEFGQRFFGFSSDEILGRNIAGTIVRETEPSALSMQAMLEAIEFNPDLYINSVNENVGRNGEKVWVAWTNKPILDDGGHIREMLCIGNDITARKRVEDELQKLASVVKYSSELVNLATMDGKMIFLNDAGARALGIEPQDVELTHILDVIPDHLQEKARNEILPTLTEQGTWEGDLQCRNLKTGKLTDVHTMTFTIKDPDTGLPLFLANVSRDISERKQAEESLRQSEERFSKAFQASPAFMMISSIEDGRFIDVNESFLKAIGYGRDKVIGRTGKELGIWEPDHIDEFMYHLKTVGRVENQEIGFRTKTGEQRTALVSAEMIKIDGEYCELAVGDDITERKIAESALKESQQQLFNIINFLPDATIVVDLHGTVIAWNRAMEEITGIKSADALGKCKDILAVRVYGAPRPILVDQVLQENARLFDLYDKFEKKGDTVYAEINVPGSDETPPLSLSAIASPLYDRDGKVIGAIESFRDITKRKEIETALLEREKELEDKSLELEEINTALRVLLKNREEDQKEFGANVLTNLKELVFPYIEKLKESRLNELQKTYVSILRYNLEDIGAPFLRQLSIGFTNLSPMERQIAGLIRDGKRNKEISEILGVSPNTISTHRHHLRTKLGLKKKNINLVSYLQSLGNL
jgi:PAS domain S-box-containing protein